MMQAKRRFVQLATATLVLAAGATSVFATIVAVFPAVVEFVPADVRLNQTESDVQIIAFNEVQCDKPVKAPGLSTDQGVIPTGTKVKSHLVHMDPVTGVVLQGKVRFDTRIIGVISNSADLYDSDYLGRPGVVYPVAGVEQLRGLESTQPNDDYQIIQQGHGIRVRMDVPPFSFSDQVRVITCCPDFDPECD